jgi:hypothetical protein
MAHFFAIRMVATTGKMGSEYVDRVGVNRRAGGVPLPRKEQKNRKHCRGN